MEDRDQDLREALGNDPTKRYFYLEFPSMIKTAKGRQKVRFFTVL